MRIFQFQVEDSVFERPIGGKSDLKTVYNKFPKYLKHTHNSWTLSIKSNLNIIFGVFIAGHAHATEAFPEDFGN